MQLQRIKMYYDPRGQVIRTVNPDGSEQRVVYGVPAQLTQVGSYAPTAWETYTYDANDLDPLSPHYGTPKSAKVDAMGRTVQTLDRLESSNSTENNVQMRYKYDVRGNLLEVTDAYDNEVFKHRYDLRPPAKEGESVPPLWTRHINKGESHVVFDCTGKPVESRDAKGALVLSGYDALQRPVKVWCRDKFMERVNLRQMNFYGSDAHNNSQGKLIETYDESGKEEIPAYDFKGNASYKIKSVISNSEIQTAINWSQSGGWMNMHCYRVDWSVGAATSGDYRTDMEYDALNRVMKITYPEDASSNRKELIPEYNRAGALKKVYFDGNEYVQNIGYNAKGQRLIIAYGNNLMTRYTYDEQTFRLKRLRTERYTYSKDGSEELYEYEAGTCKQDFAYSYDKVGNIKNINDETPEGGIFGLDGLLRSFGYDALYRLLSATGRDVETNTLYPSWNDRYRRSEAFLTTPYTQTYQYDLMGNMNELHKSGANSYTRYYEHSNNLVEEFTAGPHTYYYEYDSCGNQIKENEERNFQWDYGDKLRLYYNQTAPGNEPSVYTHYLYDASGNRVKKYTRTAGGNWETITYIDGIIEYREDSSKYQSISHVMDDTKRIATIREGDDFDDPTPAIKYNLDDHLGSSNVLVDENGTLVNREEYYPYGETSFGAYAKKRYRFCGKEKDEESGLYYYGARYYAPWLCRFVSVDPLAGDYPFYTPFQYAGNKPINFIDLDGRQEFDIMYDRQTGEAFVRLVDYRTQKTNTGIKLNEVTTTNRQDPNFAIIATTDSSQFADIQGGYFDVIKVTREGVYFRQPNGIYSEMKNFSHNQQNASGNPYQPDYSAGLRFNPNNATQMTQVDVPQSSVFTMIKSAGGTPSTVQTYQVTIPPSSTTATMTINAGMDSQISNSLVVTDSNNSVVSTTASSTNPNGQVFDTVNLTDATGNTSIVVQPGQTYTFTVTAGSTTPQDAYNITVTVGTTNPVMIPSTGNPQSIPPTNPTSTQVQPTTSR